jgi:hypothetical protein
MQMLDIDPPETAKAPYTIYARMKGKNTKPAEDLLNVGFDGFV